MFSPLIDPPMYVVTCKHDDEQAGCLVEFAMQCSIRPPRFLVCLSIENHTYKVAQSASTLAVHLLTDKDRAIASLFGEQTGDDVNKFSAVTWHIGTAGAPILTNCESFFEGKILSMVPFGDHVGFVLDPIDEIKASVDVEDPQLTLRDIKNFTPGHPVAAPREG